MKAATVWIFGFMCFYRLTIVCLMKIQKKRQMNHNCNFEKIIQSFLLQQFSLPACSKSKFCKQSPIAAEISCATKNECACCMIHEIFELFCSKTKKQCLNHHAPTNTKYGVYMMLAPPLAGWVCWPLAKNRKWKSLEKTHVFAVFLVLCLCTFWCFICAL
jgi:hypothetical protein